ncbi:MAG: hypothetical protein ACKKL4_02330 [Patescibacteria group bacterium]
MHINIGTILKAALVAIFLPTLASPYGSLTHWKSESPKEEQREFILMANGRSFFCVKAQWVELVGTSFQAFITRDEIIIVPNTLVGISSKPGYSFVCYEGKKMIGGFIPKLAD